MATNVCVILDGGNFIDCSEDDFMQTIQDQFARGATHLVVTIQRMDQSQKAITEMLREEFDARFVWTKSPTTDSYNVYPHKTPPA